MPKATKLSLLSVLIFIAFIQGGLAQSENLKAEIEKIIFYDTEIADRDIPGFIVGIVDGDSTYHIGFGTCKKGSNQLPDANTQFEIGGLTKIFTSFLVHILTEKYGINLHSPLNNYLDSNYLNKTLENITLKSLLTHTSGLPKLPNDLGSKETDLHNRYANYTKQDLLKYCQNLTKSDHFGEFIYSHINYALLEIVIENITGLSLEMAMQKYILNPYNLLNTSLKNPGEENKQLAQGYNKAGVETHTWSFQSFSGSEGLISTSGDLTTILSAWLNGTGKDAVVFNQSLVPFIKIPDTKKTYVADAWHLFKNKKYNIYLHSGKTSGYAAFMAFVKETKTGVVLLTNSTHPMDGLGMLILRMINNNWKRKENG
jgi:CubicO group peptidase (beta-lactamase class C family)